VVKANETELVMISRIVPIRVAFAVPQARLAEIRKAAADAPPVVRAEVPDSGAPVEGTLTFIDNAVDTTSGTIGLLATFANEDRGLWPGQYVQVLLRTGVERGVVVVPSRAVQRSQQGDYAYVVGKDNAIEMRLITVKRSSGDSAVVSQGLGPGDVVVTDGQLRLVPGAHVDPRQPSAETGR
jgi:multidrug efflux system membrane fusion protein